MRFPLQFSYVMHESEKGGFDLIEAMLKLAKAMFKFAIELPPHGDDDRKICPECRNSCPVHALPRFLCLAIYRYIEKCKYRKMISLPIGWAKKLIS